MRYLVLSDIHANLEALETVLDAAAGIPHDRVLVLGDLVGYGADPNAVVERVRGARPVLGDPRQPRQGRGRPRAVGRLQRRGPHGDPLDLRGAHRRQPRLAGRPAGRSAWPSTTCSRSATARRYDEDAYVFDETDVLRSMQASSRRLCLFGHTHVQVGYRLHQSSLTLETADPRRPLHVAHRRRATT